MQGTTDFHDHIAHARLLQTAGVTDDTAALDAAVDVLDADAAARDPPIGRFLRPREDSAPGLFRGHDDLDLVERERQEAEILEQPAARGQGIGRGIGNPFIVGTAGKVSLRKRIVSAALMSSTFFTVWHLFLPL
jgi:hypothetical protein